MILTGQQVVNGALTALGILEQGGTPSVSDSTDMLTELNNAWDAWGIDEDFIFAEQQQPFAWVANAQSVPVGPAAGAPFNIPVPSRVYRAYWTDSIGVRTEIEVVNTAKYARHKDLFASAKAPDEVYLDFNVASDKGDISMALFPVPNLNGTLELNTAALFSAWTLNGNYAIPQGFADTLNYALAWRGLPRFGAIVQQQVAEVVRDLGLKAEGRIKEMNAINRQRPLPPNPPMNAGAGQLPPKA